MHESGAVELDTANHDDKELLQLAFFGLLLSGSRGPLRTKIKDTLLAHNGEDWTGISLTVSEARQMSVAAAAAYSATSATQAPN